MIGAKFLPFVAKQIGRNRVRTALTAGGVAAATFLFVGVEALQSGVSIATEVSARDTTLVVYRENRFCPFTSRLPEYYKDQITRIPGVQEVIPMKVIVNNCRASLDVVTFRGIPARELNEDGIGWTLSQGSFADWRKRSDAALLGEKLFTRRGLRVGDSFDAAGIAVTVAGVIDSEEPQVQNAAFVHLDFLQQAADRRLGTVTQFNVKVDDPKQLSAVAKAIDEQFAVGEFPTTTRPEKAFVSMVAGDLIELIAFTRYLGWGSLAAVLALVCNAVLLSVQSRVQELGVLKTLGFNDGLIARLIIAEGALLGILGGVAGAGLGAGLLLRMHLNLSVDGLSIPIVANWGTMAIGVGGSLLVGVIAGIVPAWRASRRKIVECFRCSP